MMTKEQVLIGEIDETIIDEQRVRIIHKLGVKWYILDNSKQRHAYKAFKDTVATIKNQYRYSKVGRTIHGAELRDVIWSELSLKDFNMMFNHNYETRINEVKQ